MTDSFNTKYPTTTEPNESYGKTYTVWLGIEEHDEYMDTYTNCDAPGGALATFHNYHEAYEFAAQIDQAYSRECHDDSPEAATTTRTDLDSEVVLPRYVADAIEAVVSYLWESERRDFQGCLPADRDKHIFPQLEIVSRWLRSHLASTDHESL